jgi:signal peptidase I
MLNSKDRQTLKAAREIFRGAQKWVRINRDLLAPQKMQDISTKLKLLEEGLLAENAKEAARQADELEQKIHSALPAQKHATIRENVEVLLVAVIVAMAVRTFFIQPFKIPTGSMQPTLYGIFPPPERPPLEYGANPPSILDRIAGVIFGGKMYDQYGYRSRGDHIFVDKVSYHFRKPHRGEVIVFDTSNIAELGGASRGKFYIKRLIGLENDVIQINPPHVLVNGSFSARFRGRSTSGLRWKPIPCRPNTCSCLATIASAAWMAASGARFRRKTWWAGRFSSTGRSPADLAGSTDQYISMLSIEFSEYQQRRTIYIMSNIRRFPCVETVRPTSSQPRITRRGRSDSTSRCLGGAPARLPAPESEERRLLAPASSNPDPPAGCPAPILCRT